MCLAEWIKERRERYGSKPPVAQKSSCRYVTASADRGWGCVGWETIDKKRQNPPHMRLGCRADLCDTNMG